jgi:hypothetical protein
MSLNCCLSLIGCLSLNSTDTIPYMLLLRLTLCPLHSDVTVPFSSMLTPATNCALACDISSSKQHTASSLTWRDDKKDEAGWYLLVGRDRWERG